ncbi:NAD(P)H-dependent nitrate reductase catalytic subunit /NAD(P)H-dependent nitrate reductase iron-sulfur subunit /NAD(P)H-dependent nitrate reductase diaphorase subunit [Solirubrobacter pauli]|uniref:NAD(P)H-dependent nitrate reductase catalytic subunit /NAD(P)H-dependent nitrate reductase iron-sulfur subunit /NAD(P)H-dependent nitrate reductase diaphorase subunit n=1 Tax=Solirubrobacter pauli TaxID=166793 RepID=A0A660LDE9_9ACTN|nr:molybdopterin-dependent oxidoreductase [Solirubrobacter pauli]RKQ90741.1 NAD(P)H-dependent nitrate reductase catalytic subunit /NAD(P)H-dependent nitrate reductase iron-sulfur subunit /NAD(P)H-dependent nitrate reductase diaphorase subunit [Solirubrobacter pauli]
MKTTCPYCGVGCGLVADVRDGRLVSVRGDTEHPVNRGATCRKPTRLPEAVHAPDRATTPLRRASLDDRWRPASWRSVVNDLAKRLQGVRPDEIAFYISGQLLTEDYYAVNKLAKGFLGTNNLDSNSRLCMSSAVAGYTGALGSDGPPPSYADVEEAEVLFLLGSNAASCHPIVWNRIRSQGAFLIVADPRRTPTAEHAGLHLPVRPGTDLPLLNAMLHVLERDGLLDRRFLDRHTRGADDALTVAADWSPSRAAEVCGVPAEDIVEAARRFGSSKRAMALWSMGANQSTVGTLKNRALINLCLATGNIARPGAGPLSLTGQPNAMGGRETGGLSTLLPGYRSVSNAEDRAWMGRFWDSPGIAPEPGIAATELVEALEEDRIKVLWVVATNPVVSQPDAGRFTAALRRAELVVCQDAYFPTETGALAHMILPAAQWPEKDGTMTNSERRVSLVRRALDPPGEALPDWEIFTRVGRALGHPTAFPWRTAAAVHAEYVQTTEGRVCDQTGISHSRLRREGPIQWPCPSPDHPGTERLYASRRFPTPDGRARLAPTPHTEPADAVTPDFPLVLTTGRVAQQWHTMTRTGKSKALLDAEPHPFVEVHPADAEGLPEKVRVRSRRGSAVLRLRVSENVPRGVVFAPFHWGALHLAAGEGALNNVTSRAIDPVSKQPELKACAVRLEPVAAEVLPARGGRHVVIVGAGMAGNAVAETVLAHEPGRRVTLIGREDDAPYNRVLLSQALAGDIDDARLALHQADGTTLRLGAGVRGIDLRARTVELADGGVVAYDDLVLATGSAPWLPPIPGLDRPGVFAFRSLADMRAIREAAGSARRAVVVGGGLLGLEAARGLREQGVDVTVVHLADRLMELQLDPLAARLLERRIRALGIDVLCGRRTEAVVDGRATARAARADDAATVPAAGAAPAHLVTLDDGTALPADLVVFATGIRPEVSLARDAGLEVGRGVLVDDNLRTSAPGVWAVGECAEHRGVVYGLWAPVLEQARAAGAAIAGRPNAFHGAVPATTLKVAGIDLFCAGAAAEPDPLAEEVIALDSRRERYRKLVLRDGALAGATLLGDVADARALRGLIASGEAVPEALLESGPPTGDAPADHLVCSCQTVSRSEIVAAIRDRKLTTVAAVSEHTGAATGCGGCRPDVEALLKA